VGGGSFGGEGFFRVWFLEARGSFFGLFGGFVVWVVFFFWGGCFFCFLGFFFCFFGEGESFFIGVRIIGVSRIGIHLGLHSRSGFPPPFITGCLFLPADS